MVSNIPSIAMAFRVTLHLNRTSGQTFWHLCNLNIGDQSLTEYVSKAERLSTNLKSWGETLADSLLIAMVVMRGLPDRNSSFIVVLTQSNKAYTFVEFKTTIHDFNENLKSRESCAHSNSSVSKDSVMKTKEQSQKLVKCYGCKKIGHYARNCPVQ